MKKMPFILIIIFLAILSKQGYSGIKKVAQTGIQFLKIDVGARPAAMGGAYLMIDDDATAMFYNSAGISKMRHSFEFLATQTQWIADITYTAFAVAYNAGTMGQFGVSGIVSDYGKIFGTQIASNDLGFIETGNLSATSYVMGLTYARALTDKFSIGGQVKYVYQQLGESITTSNTPKKNAVGGLAYDFGTIFYPGYKSFRFGMTIRNFSQQFKYEKTAFELPLTFSIGIAMDVLDFFDQAGDHSLLLAIDALHPRDYTERLHVGFEYAFHKMFFLRGGYKINYDEEGLSAGVGFQKELFGGNIIIDYSYSDGGVFNAVNRFSFGIAF